MDQVLPTVLVVDDELANLRVFERAFRKRYTILSASSAAAACTFARSIPAVDVAFVDLSMPHVDGAAVLAELRRIDPRIVRYLLTGYGELDETMQLQRDGLCHAVIAKPWDRSTIVAAVEDGLRLVAASAGGHRGG